MSLRLGNQIISGISRETKLNAHSLLDFKWADHILNEMSWLRADTFSWQSGDVYTSVYNLLLAEYQNGTEETEGDITFKRSTNGFKIATSSYENAISNKYNTDGIAWYYILDTTNKRFKLPRTTHREVIESYVDGANGYRIWSDGYCEQWGSIHYEGDFNGYTVAFPKTFKNLYYNFMFTCVSTSKNTNVSSGQGVRTTSSIIICASQDGASTSNTYSSWRASGYLADGQYNKDSLPNNKNLYFYVGEFAQTATEQTAGLNSEMLNDKVDKADLTTCHVVVETYVNGTSGYRIWDDGYCEQWGVIGFSATSGWVSGTVSLPKTYANTNYCLLGRGNWSDAGSSDFRVNSMDVDSFNVAVAINTMTEHNGQWYACGYLAEGQY